MSAALDRATKAEISEQFRGLLRQGRLEGWQSVGRLLLEPYAIGQMFVGLCFLTMPLVATWTLALVPPHLLRPRPRWRRLAARPGLVAACASIVAIALIGLPIVVVSLTIGNGWKDVSERLAAVATVFDLAMCGGMAILASWMTLLIGQRWCAEPSWLDRAGRVMGTFWIAEGFAAWAGTCLIQASQLCHFGASRINPSGTAAVGHSIVSWVHFTMPAVGLGTLALILFRLLGPRPRHRWRMRQPGIIAGIASLTALAALGLPLVAIVTPAINGWPNLPFWLPDDVKVVLGARFGGLAVLVSWLTLLLGRRRRADPGWVDRLGRAAGVLWIMAGLAVELSVLLIQVG